MSFKTKLLAGVALAAVCTAPALAADLSGIPYVGTNWAGPYAGFALGVAHTSADVSASSGNASVSISGTDSQLSANFIAGYNWQHGNTVFGIEADIDAVSDWNYVASIRGRYGVLTGNWLVYGTAGLGLVDFGGSVSGGGFHWDGYSKAGLVIGAGAETKLSHNWVAGGEALYYWFGDDTQNIGNGASIKTSVDVFAIRARLTYRIDNGSEFLK